ncbi:MAG: hypothetical protein MJ198_01280 [Bacteroidales bacterium]|nr:hypothetical protein [Bacteroidales bacterium]
MMKKLLFLVLVSILASCSSESQEPEDSNSLYQDNGKMVFGRYKDCGCTPMLETHKYYYENNKVTKHIFEITSTDATVDVKTYYEQMKDDKFYKSVSFQEPNTVVVDCYFDEMIADSARKRCKEISEECNPLCAPM